jgi:hypothetical protein
VGVLNLNSQFVSGVNPLALQEYSPGSLVPESYLGSQWIGTDGRTLGTSNQGLDFSLLWAGREHPEDARVLAVSPEEDRVYAFHFTEATRLPLSFAYAPLQLACWDGEGNPQPCRPLDIAVETIKIAGADTALAFTANADAAGLSIIDPYALSVYPDAIKAGMCHAQEYPVSLDTRDDGSWGYVANYSTDNLMAVNLEAYMNGTTSCDAFASIPVGMAPVRVVVQEVPSSESFAKTVNAALTYAPPSAFEQPVQQETLIRAWEDIRNLQETNASSQAVLVHLDNFARNAVRWIADPTVSSNVIEGVDLYRAAYLQENGLPGNP